MGVLTTLYKQCFIRLWGFCRRFINSVLLVYRGFGDPLYSVSLGYGGFGDALYSVFLGCWGFGNTLCRVFY